VIRGGQTFASIAFGTTFRSRDIAGLVLSRVQRTSESRLARGGERRGAEKVQRARTGRTNRAGAIVSRREQLGSERDFEGNLKFKSAPLASLRDESATVEQTDACAGEAAQAVARCAVLGTQGFRPGLGVCRAYGAGFFG
jgi:hypothetical protein